MKNDRRFSITIWNPQPKSPKKLFTKEECNKIISRVLEKETPYSIEVYRELPDGWKTMVYSYYTENEFNLFKK